MSVAISAQKPHPFGTHNYSVGPASKRIVVSYGFWIFLLSDFIMFAGFFAAYAVLKDSVADGPRGRELFDVYIVAIETACLLLSSFTCGMATVAVALRNLVWTQIWLLVTGLLGLAFFVLEIHEFHELTQAGHGPQRSAFLSAFFTLVGCHGAHIIVGGLWLGTMMAQVWIKGFRETVIRRLMCFSLFWHALDIIWVAILTIVYLMGVIE
ncbi:cytochrome (ubi)quinol oxidase subunit III [Pseudomonas sp. 17104299]|uniref:cytochrome (ubi)quinol oxidase subunit III n=1 Tax=Pseudomonas sp. 17104299 TaxID=2952239 RepID=UPI00215724F5|nr:cytochrome (ubi)quinol oxidase subunit III [Pseudomonas sp. 17104299]